MSMIPEVKCRRCGQSFSALRSRCPNCGTRRVVQSGRTPGTTPGTVKGTPAYERADTNTKWQMIFGLNLVVAVILAVIVMVSTSLNGLDNTAATSRRSRSTPTPAVATEDPALYIEAAPTPSPTPTPTVESIKLFFYNSELTQEKGGFTMYTNDEPLTITASAYPADTFANASFTWRTDDPDCLQLTPSEDGKSCEVAILQAKAGGTKLYASCYGVEYWVPVYLIQRN